MNTITQIAFAQREISWRRNRSLATVISSQNQAKKTEHRENVHQEISIREAFCKEHRNLLVLQMDLFDVSTISSRLPYGFLILEGPSASRYVTIMRISMASRMMREGADSATKFYVTSSLYAMLASPGSIR